MRIRTISRFLLVFFLYPAAFLSADGVLEINQTCALNGGCFSGDTDGFPVTINGNAGVSYRLTGSLNLSAHPTDSAISVSESFITIDLNGFEIAGATGCIIEPTIGAELICTPSNGGAHGIELIGSLQSVVVKNGTIRGMPDDGVSGEDAEFTGIEDLTFSENAGWGATLGDRSQVQNSRARWNGGGGFSVKDDSNISHSQAHGNDGDGFETGERAVVSFSNGEAGFSPFRAFDLGPGSKYRGNASRGGSRCGGGICTERRRFYLTQTTHDGNEALGACESGFHMASIMEIRESGHWRYDSFLGVDTPDAGSGLPLSDLSGWVRSGGGSANFENCSNWTSDSDMHKGAIFTALGFSALDGDLQHYPWLLNGGLTSDIFCDDPLRVWCAEND